MKTKGRKTTKRKTETLKIESIVLPKSIRFDRGWNDGPENITVKCGALVIDGATAAFMADAKKTIERFAQDLSFYQQHVLELRGELESLRALMVAKGE